MSIAGVYILLDLLGLDDSLTFLAVDGLLLLLELVESVDTSNGAEDQSRKPRAVGVLLDALHGLELAVAHDIDDSDSVEGEVTGVAELTTDSQVAEDWVNGGLVVEGNRGSLQVLEELAHTHELTGSSELLLNGIVGVDGRLWLVGAVQIPGIEAGEVLDCAKKLVAADCGAGFTLAFPVGCLRG